MESSAPSVLVVDDESAILDTLRILLRNEGFDPHIALGGKRALEQIESLHPDIVLTDIRMPAVGGTEVLAAAREAGGWFNVLHMHGDDVHFDLLSAYEVSALNWHIGETPTRIEDYRRAGGTRPIVGGLRRQDLTESRLDGIRRSIGQTVAETDGRGLILTPACVIRYPVVPDTLRHAARLIREWPIARALSPAQAERPHALAL